MTRDVRKLETSNQFETSQKCSSSDVYNVYNKTALGVKTPPLRNCVFILLLKDIKKKGFIQCFTAIW